MWLSFEKPAMESINESVAFYNLIEKKKDELNHGCGKLCTSPLTLSHINKALEYLRYEEKSTTFEISYNLKIVLYELENILKAVKKLKLFQRNVATFSGPCDLKQCSSLKDIEFLRVSLDNICGVNLESNEICYVSCSRCTNVFDLFTFNAWQNLKTLSISYCNLVKINSECFSNIRNVERLILSYNNLKSSEGLNTLNKLQLLDVSFNSLENIPLINEACSETLTEFYTSHNNITSLKGIKRMKNLTCLDASNNCIFQKEILVELYDLTFLSKLKLDGNPISISKHYRMYVSHFLGSTVPPYQFILDNVALHNAEIDFMGSSKGVAAVTNRPTRSRSSMSQSEVNINNEIIPQTRGILKSSNRKVRKARDVIIVDAVGDPISTPAARLPKKTGVIVQESVTLEAESMSNNEEHKNHEPLKSDSNQVLPENEFKNICQNEISNEMFDNNDTIHEKIIHPSYQNEIHSSPENMQTECHTVEVTIHATQEEDGITNNINQIVDSISNQNIILNDNSKDIDINDIRILESIDLMLQKDQINQMANNTDSTDEFLDATSNGIDEANNSLYASVDNINNNTNFSITSNVSENDLIDETIKSKEQLSSEDSASDDGIINGDEYLWPVQKMVENEKPVNMFLVLLDYEMRERSTVSGRTVASFPLGFVQSCTQISNDPITVEIIFSSILQNTIVRTYIMEYADAQTLMSKINLFLESRPDVVEAQLTSFVCKSCQAYFSVFKTQARTLCTVCGSASVEEIESVKPDASQALSRTSSQSSVVSTSLGGIVTKASPNIITNPSSVSTVSSEPGDEKTVVIPTSTPQKYESDVEIISNPSQSSIEVLDDNSASIYKRSSEERHISSSPTLSTLDEVITGSCSDINRVSSSDEVEIGDIPLEAATDDCDTFDSLLPDQTPLLSNPNQAANIQTMTESSSSGSVLTSYEANDTTSNPVVSTDQGNPDTTLEASVTLCDDSINNASLLETSTESIKQAPSDIYTFTNFTEVDHRIKAFLYQYIFVEDSEELTLFIRCHMWKTGGTDYPACFVLSNKRIYILMHTSTDYGLDASDWLKLKESHDLKSMKKAYPLIWNLGVGLQINQFKYSILLFVKSHTDNLLSHFKSLSIKSLDIGSKQSSKVELNLQQVVLSSKYVHDVIDPTILLFTICLKINILQDDEIQEIMSLGGFVMTANEFYVVLGDLGWLTGSGSPTIHFFQMMRSLIEIGQKDNIVSLHFLNEEEAVEVVWLLHCSNSAQVDTILNAMKVPWESVFSEPLQVIKK